MSQNNLEHHKSVYLKVLIGLFILTVLTVVVAFFDFGSMSLAIFVGLIIAFIKGFLVAGNFMHLFDEVKPIYWILLITLVFFLVLFFMPTLWEANLVRIK